MAQITCYFFLKTTEPKTPQKAVFLNCCTIKWATSTSMNVSSSHDCKNFLPLSHFLFVWRCKRSCKYARIFRDFCLLQPFQQINRTRHSTVFVGFWREVKFKEGLANESAVTQILHSDWDVRNHMPIEIFDHFYSSREIRPSLQRQQQQQFNSMRWA